MTLKICRRRNLLLTSGFPGQHFQNYAKKLVHTLKRKIPLLKIPSQWKGEWPQRCNTFAKVNKINSKIRKSDVNSMIDDGCVKEGANGGTQFSVCY